MIDKKTIFDLEEKLRVGVESVKKLSWSQRQIYLDKSNTESKKTVVRLFVFNWDP